MKRASKCSRIFSCRGLFGCDASENCLKKKTNSRARPFARAGNEHHRFYNSKVWRGIRDIQLSAYPLCERCLGLGVVTPAVAVDHVTPHKGDWSLFIAQDNRQSLCVSCHSYKTAMENRGVIEDYRDSRDKQTK